MASNTVFLFNGIFQAASNINCNGMNNVHLVGRDGFHYENQVSPAYQVQMESCAILFTGAGPNVSFGTNVNTNGTSGCGISGLSIIHTGSPPTSSVLVQAAGIGFSACNVVLNAGSYAGLCCVLIDGVVTAYFDRVYFYGSQYGVYGVKSSQYSNVVTIRDCEFKFQCVARIINPSQQWLVENCWFETPLSDGYDWVHCNASGSVFVPPVSDLMFINCYQYDAVTGAAGSIFTFNCSAENVTIIGCTANVSGGANAVNLAAGESISGLTMIGNHFQNAQYPISTAGTIFPTSGWTGASITNATISGNEIGTGVTDNSGASVASGNIQSGLIVRLIRTALPPSRKTSRDRSKPHHLLRSRSNNRHLGPG